MADNISGNWRAALRVCEIGLTHSDESLSGELTTLETSYASIHSEGIGCSTALRIIGLVLT